MRPTRLELKGFSIYREHTVVDFSDVDLFALTGATGAGKSSIIDAIVFALYGSVTRYRNVKLVAPVINQLSNEARVRLDFTIDDTDYTAVRVVRRTRSGASTKEARLEQGDTILAGNARELDDAVAERIGLSFDQFTKTVVLPQGEFAQFLTDNAKDRQALLRRLLGVELFRTMATSARDRAKIAAARRDVLREQLDSDTVTAAEVADLDARREALELLGDDIRTEVAALDEAGTERDRAQRTAEVLSADITLLEKTQVPDDVRSAGALIDAADAELDEAQVLVGQVSESLAAAQRTAAEHGSIDELRRRAAVHDDLAPAAERAELAYVRAAEAERKREQLVTAVSDARSELDALDGTLEKARRLAGAQGLRRTLESGAPCPVCEQVVHQIPSHDFASELVELDRRRENLVGELRDLDKRHRDAVQLEADARADARTHADRVAELRSALAESDDPGRDELVQRLDAAVAAHQALSVAQAQASEALARLRRATGQREQLDERVRSQRQEFTTVRDRLGNLAPPAPDGTSVFDDWTALAEWADQEIATRRALLAEAETERSAAADRAGKHAAVLADRCAPFVEGAMPADLPAWHSAAVARAEEKHRAAQSRLETQAATRTRVDELEGERSVAALLGQLLGASGFEQWLMEDSMRELAHRASAHLHELSGGAYSLVVDGADFAICDHHNADELRAARSLSGGETFLASLALALALADSVAELATAGTPVVESMFLDEGFGTLDAETLDIVAATIEELGASGRMIGIVTHISSLAERLPTRFDVRRSSGSSTVVRIDS